ncbi:MAG: hypothetical protein AAB353_01090, partial [Candidatus Hydrogenedentota bacterium]
RRLASAKIILPRALITLVAIFLAKARAVSKMVGNERENFVIGNPLVLLANPLRLRRVTTAVSNYEAVEVAETFCGPAKIKDAPQDVSLDQPKVEARWITPSPLPED